MQHFSSTLTKFNMKDVEHKVEKEQKSLNELKKKSNIIIKIIQTSPCSTKKCNIEIPSDNLKLIAIVQAGYNMETYKVHFKICCCLSLLVIQY